MFKERDVDLFPENVKSVLSAMEAHALEYPRTRNVTRELGTLLYNAIKFKRAKGILEVGTSNGYSTIYLTQAAKENGGHVITIEKYQEKSDQAKQNIQLAGLKECVDIVTGQAQEILPKLTEQIDFLFMDILPEEYLTCVEMCQRQLKKGSIVICDNFFGHRDGKGGFMERGDEGNNFIEFAMTNFKSVSDILDIGSGIVICEI